MLAIADIYPNETLVTYDVGPSAGRLRVSDVEEGDTEDGSRGERGGGGVVLGGKRLKSPSGFQSERCHQHMCSRHVGGGGSINEGASLSDLLRHPHSGNFISHNRALKPPLRISFTPTAVLCGPRLTSPPSFFLHFFRQGSIPSSFRPAAPRFSASAPTPLASLYAYELSSLFPSVDPSPSPPFVGPSDPIVFERL